MAMYDVTMGRGAASVETMTVRVRVTDAAVAAEYLPPGWTPERVAEGLAIQAATRRRWGRSAQWSAEHGSRGLRGQVTRPARMGGSDCVTPTIGVDVERV